MILVTIYGCITGHSGNRQKRGVTSQYLATQNHVISISKNRNGFKSVDRLSGQSQASREWTDLVDFVTRFLTNSPRSGNKSINLVTLQARSEVFLKKSWLNLTPIYVEAEKPSKRKNSRRHISKILNSLKFENRSEFKIFGM